MKQVLVTGAGVVVDEVPAPQTSPRGILVRVRNSCVSVGTEMAAVRSTGEPLYRRALRQPEKVKRLLQQVREQGLRRTANFVSGKLAEAFPSGYSAAGVVLAVGEEVDAFRVGDRVACAGSTANHAEVIDVPVNLAVRIPDAVSFDAASTVALGAIALQGVRRASPTLGETIVVVGLGFLGQLTAQMLVANGCRVVGVDIDPARVDIAKQNGMQWGVDAGADDYVSTVQRLTDGFGADAVIVTAASRSDEVMSSAMAACRRKGRVVLVGDVGLNLNRADFYRKELDFFISTSYGPGRYDPVYEEQGVDYPLPYVRWTEHRNMDEYLRLLADGRVSLAQLSSRVFGVEQAPIAYGALNGGGGQTPMLVLLSYPEHDGPPVRTVALRVAPQKGSAIRVALVGAGSFAQGVHLPNIQSLPKEFALHAVMSRTGATAQGIATRFGATYATTDIDKVLGDPDVDLVLIATRHHLHGPLTLRALEAGKNVFVEKPLALAQEELDAIAAFFQGTNGRAPLLTTGFNRRFSPPIVRAMELIENRTTPLMASYRMNAGFVPPDSWVHGPEGGGRNIGEACHIYDLFTKLTGARATDVRASAARAKGRQWHRNDNFVATISFDDGSVCTLTYTALGHRAYAKEQMELFADGKVIVLDDYKELRVVDSKARDWSSATQNKGTLEELAALAAAIRAGAEWPIPLWQQLQATQISFDVERQIMEPRASGAILSDTTR
jgi:predicted dehydrogenase/threonine dehydrogenase-like Zn-dependent dehydrogenase